MHGEAPDNKKRMEGSARNGRRYANPPGSPARKGSRAGWLSFYLRRITHGIAGAPPLHPSGHALSRNEVLAGIGGAEGRDSLTWLGHASFLIRQAGVTVLTDPFLSDYATGHPPFGPRRHVPPALTVEELPPIDLLLISHNHYDHLDAPTIEALSGKARMTVLAPLGLGGFFRDRGYGNVHELDWHQTHDLGPLCVTVLPAVHNSGRSLWDKNETLWAGFALRSAERNLLFAGDTAYGAVFREVGDRYGPFDVALVPISSYEPVELMAGAHTNPEEAVAIACDIRARTAVAMHWGTIVLTDEPAEEPPGRFIEAGRAAGFDDEDLWLLAIGETRPLSGK